MSARSLPALLAVLCLCAGAAIAQDLPVLEYEKYTLDNGLDVILHVDRTTPTAAVNVWYHVGSKNEKPGPGDAEQNIHAQIAFGMDHADYVLMRAPRPTLICSASPSLLRNTCWGYTSSQLHWFGPLGPCQ